VFFCLLGIIKTSPLKRRLSRFPGSQCSPTDAERLCRWSGPVQSSLPV